MVAQSKGLKFHLGMVLKDNVFGTPTFNCDLYPGLETLVSQIEFTVPHATPVDPKNNPGVYVNGTKDVVFPLPPPPAAFIIVPQYDALRLFDKAYRQGINLESSKQLPPDAWPDAGTLTFTVNDKTPSLTLSSTKVFLGDYEELQKLVEKSGGGSSIVNWHFENADHVLDQAVTMIAIQFVDAPWGKPEQPKEQP